MRKLFLWLLLAVPVQAAAQEVEVTASVDATTVGADDTLTLTVTVSGRDNGDAGTPRLPRFRGFQVVSGPSVSTQFQWINGRSSSSKSFIYSLLPEREGQLTLDPIEVPVGGRIHRTQPIAVRVVAGSTRPAAPRRRAFDPFGDSDLRPRAPRTGEEVNIVADLDRASAVPGQQVTLTYRLYARVSVTGLQLQESPPLTGFWVEDLEVDKTPTGVRRVVDGREYFEYVVKKQALFPNEAGKLRIPPSTFAISIKTTGDFFGLFSQPETVYRKTKELELDVQPLPAAGRPEAFRNAVGSFNLTASLDKSQAATGDAVSLLVKLSGRGNLKVIGDVPLPPLPDFTIYSSKRADNVRPFEGDSIGGDKTWEYIIVPKAPGEQAIPPITFAYFDPERGRYETLSTEPLPLRVVPGADAGGGVTGLSGVHKQPLQRQASDIHFIKLEAPDLDGPGRPPYASLWFYLLAGLPLAFSVGAFFYDRERARDSADAAVGRRRRARRAAFARLRAAERAARADPRRFYDEASRALSGYLTDRFGIPEIAVTGDSLERSLSEQGVSASTIATVAEALAECDFGRFVSASADPVKLRELARRIRALVDTLERA